MSQEQEQALSSGAGGSVLQRHRLALRRPLLTSLLFVSGAVLFVIASFFTDTLFPLLTLFGVPSSPLCLSLAFVLGLSGVLICIIHMIEYFDRRYFRNCIVSETKGA
jgi:hypothetical protein